MPTTVLKPGLLVSLKTSTRGGVAYIRRDTDPDHLDENGARVATWETTREIDDPAEFERAQSARNRARTTVARVCFGSSFGLLCPQAKEAELNDAIAAARQIAREHNAGASRTTVEVFVIVGRIAQDDAEAARAVASELRTLMVDMQQGIAAADPSAIREAASRARALGGMLSAEVSGKVSGAILEARAAARLIARRVEKAGESAATVVREVSTARIEAARFAFLDVDANGAPVEEPEAPAARGVDFDPAAPAQSAAGLELPFSLEV